MQDMRANFLSIGKVAVQSGAAASDLGGLWRHRGPAPLGAVIGLFQPVLAGTLSDKASLIVLYVLGKGRIEVGNVDQG